MKRTMKKISAAVLALALLFSLAGCGGKTVNSDGTVTEKKNGVKITATAAKSVTLEKYETDDFSIKIPKGWKVTTGASKMFHSIRVCDPQSSVNQMFILLKAQPLLHDESGVLYYQKSFQMYGGNYGMMAKAPVLKPASTENFFKIFSQYASFAEEVEPEYSEYKFPRFDSFTVTEQFESNSSMKSAAINPAMLRATFTENGKKGEGLFTADVVDFTGNMVSGFGIDAGYYMAYNIMAITAEENSFIDWQSVLAECLGSVEYSDSFVSGAIASSDQQVKQAQQISAMANETLNGIMSSWESRNTSQDITSQKQSDATLGYERVYDTDTGEIYKAYNGFTDDYSGNRYQAVTDDMYTKPVDGYIEK